MVGLNRMPYDGFFLFDSECDSVGNNLNNVFNITQEKYRATGSSKDQLFNMFHPLGSREIISIPKQTAVQLSTFNVSPI